MAMERGTKSERYICDECGQSVSIWVRKKHKAVCGVPGSDALLEELKGGATQKELADKYGVSSWLINKRVQKADGWEEYKRYVRSLPKNGRQPLKRYDGPACACGVLLSHPDAQPVENGRCVFCNAAPRRVSLDDYTTGVYRVM